LIPFERNFTQFIGGSGISPNHVMNDSVFRQGYRLHKCLLLHELIICFAPKYSGHPAVNTHTHTHTYICVCVCIYTYMCIF